MAKKGKKGSYNFKLGDKASVFYDPQSKVKVLPNQVTEFEGRMTARMRTAIQHGHIIDLDKAEAKEIKYKIEGGQPIFSSMNKGDLLKYYTGNYDVTDDEGVEFSELKKDAMVEFLEDLEEENSGDE